MITQRKKSLVRKKKIKMKGLAIIIMIVLVIANGIEGQPPSPSGNVMDFNCGLKCASQCFARSMMNSLTCMTKCIVGCMSSSPPSDALLGCTFDCATTSTVFPDNKQQFESIQDFKKVGDSIGNCYAKCDEKMIN